LNIFFTRWAKLFTPAVPTPQALCLTPFTFLTPFSVLLVPETITLKIFKEVFGRIWALWALVVFVVPMLVFVWFYLICFLLPERAGARLHRFLSQVWMVIFLNLAGCPLKLVGKKNYKKGTNYIVVCNHSSLMDVPVTTPFLPGPHKTIAKKSFAKAPFFGWIYMAGSIMVDRKSDKSRRESYEQMKHVLAIGLDMVIYPEGTRNKTGQPLKSFYDGAFRLAVDTKKPIMPVIIYNTGKALPVGKPFFMLPYKLQMHFLPPVSSENITHGELKQKVYTMMWNYFEANR
jgi:1-acyl-sn-glycerol-3-phosphate acyltransferase